MFTVKLFSRRTEGKLHQPSSARRRVRLTPRRGAVAARLRTVNLTSCVRSCARLLSFVFALDIRYALAVLSCHHVSYNILFVIYLLNLLSPVPQENPSIYQFF